MQDIRHIHPASPLLPFCPPALSPDDYLSDAAFEADMDRIWRRSWLAVGRDSDMSAGSMRRILIAGRNLVLVKDRGGALTAFFNTCRHRGAELCEVDAKPLGSRVISCPYHQWSYDLSGRLVRIPFEVATPDFDKADHGLVPVHVRRWNGFVFVCMARDAPDFDSVADPAPTALDHWPMADLVTGHRMVRRLACNWKIFWENYNECLHCPGIHPGLTDLVPVYKRGIMSDGEAADWQPGQPSGPVLKPGARSWTMNGQACGPEFSGLSDAEREGGMHFVTLLPSMFVVGHVDYVRAVTLRPVSARETELVAEWLFLPETLARPDFDLANVTDFAARVLEEDAAACEMNQRGLVNREMPAGRLMSQEFDVHRFHQWIRERHG